MSARRSSDTHSSEIERIKNDLKCLHARVLSANSANIACANYDSTEFDKLNPVEQSAASLGVNPSSLKPIAFLNNGHYKQLIESNMLDDVLARRIEAYRQVAAQDAINA